ncbi:MAG TPA: universal stress protein [Williamwhitmania sp.]|nr:universal stress protein [Williamwhitmania sp.]
MENILLRIVVPWDFTPVAENALKYAIAACKERDAYKIDLVHVVSPGGLFAKGKLTKKEAEERLVLEIEKVTKEHGIKLNSKVLEGTIFTALTEYADETKADFVFMGTHGIKGVQKLTGSWALKVIAGSNVPFIVVQDEPSSGHQRVFEHIVVPVDFKPESKELMIKAVKTAIHFGSKIHLFKQNSTDQGVLKKINSNMLFAKSQVEEYRIPFEQHFAAKTSGFADDIVKLAQDIEADLILVMTTKNIDFSDYIFGAQEQYIIANNAKLPVMCFNPSMVR